MFIACHHKKIDLLVPKGYAKLFAYPNKPNYAQGNITILDSGAFYFYISKQVRQSDYIASLQAHYIKHGQVANTYCSAPDVALDPFKTMQAYEEWYKTYDTKVFPVLQCKSKRLDLNLLKKQLEFYHGLESAGVIPDINFIAMANPGISPLEAKNDLTFLRKLISIYQANAWVHILGAGFNAQDVQDWHACGFDSIDSISYYTDAQQGVRWLPDSYEKEILDLEETTWTSIALDNLLIANKKPMTAENPILLLYNQLPPAQQRAVAIIQTFIDTYNSKDGTGLFSGVARYQYLEDRTKIAAVQSRSLLDFWSNLRQKLGCPISNKGDDANIVKMWMLPTNEQHETINSLATRAAEVIMIARSLADQDKADRILANTPINPDTTTEPKTEKPRGRKKDAATTEAEPNPKFNDPLPATLL